MADFTQNTSAIAEFFQDRSIFITGGTGFVGKVLIEKLLRSCPGIKNVYILVRSKRGQDVNTRLLQLTNCPLFDRLRNEQPSALDKIVPIAGDVSEPQLGISESDLSLLIETVSVVFHSAATVKFDEGLKLAVTVNVLAAKRLLELCRQMLGLKAMIHVSTAYCNAGQKELREVIYSTPYDPDKIIECVKWMDDDLIEAITPKLIGDRPNTYTYTKALTEELLVKEVGKLPLAIVRPSIVIPSLKEPVPGWLDSLNGCTGLLAAVGKGIFRTMYGRNENVTDLIPVDMVVNLMIAAAWRTTTRPDEVKIYNICTSVQNPITWEVFNTHCVHYFRTHPLSGLVWYPYVCCRSNWLLNKLAAISFQTLPAYFLDFFCRLIGKEPFLVKIQNKLSKGSKALEYFTLNEWRFYDDNVKSLNSILSNEDREKFYFDVRDIDWQKCLKNYVLGIRTFLLKDDPSTLPSARKRVQILFWIHWLPQLFGVFLLWRFLRLSLTFFEIFFSPITEI